ncbi:HAMP domain-containing protein [Streptomyces sp. P38-E01]|uniref:Circadian input-output histidine kinase CikA n=2 Tax=Streptomyces tardus TaxID=2780544 RepID=A0A949JK32_9ACTN|nr:HAMP domain-containing protein [Streptomyces tardus]
MESGAETRASGTRTKSGRSRRAGTVEVDAAAVDRLRAALEAMRDGNFRKRLTVTGEGPMAEISAIFNEVADRNMHLAGELSRVRRVVGRDGKLTERLEVGAGEGAWATSVEAANSLVDDLVRPVSEVGQVLNAVAEGDLEQRMDLRVQRANGTQPLRGEFLKVGKTVNGLVELLSVFTDEVTRVASEVGTEGKLGGQAKVRGMSGSWKDLTDSVNTMASRLTAQVRDIALVTTAVAKGDLSRKVTVHVAGEMLELKNTVNTMVDQLSSFQSEVTRVAREVGTEGELGGQARVDGVAGVWQDLTDSVNLMAGNLTSQVREIARVTTAVASGDLSQKVTVNARGEVAKLAGTMNTMTETLRTFADEVTRAAREVGTEGILGGQAQVPGAAGIWKDLTDSVNTAFRNLTGQVRDIAQVTTAVANGDLSQKVTVDVSGEMLELKNTVNTMVDQLSSFAEQVTRMARDVGTEGRLGGQARVDGVSGTWKDLTDSVNFMAGNLTSQVRQIAQVTTAVARGDLSQKIEVDARGEILELKNTINTMVDQLSAFADQVTRVAREVGTEGRLGGQAQVPGVAGVWRDLTDSVNFMAGNLTAQVRNISQVATAVARGDLSQKIDVDARGEILELKTTINTMVDQLSSFAEQVTRVAREVGTEGKLGGQARVRDVAGTWKDLTESVNEMAGNLTRQMRAIAQVATAVTRGDHGVRIDVDASGEILELQGYINTMISNLRETTLANQEQDWLKGNLARISGLMQGRRDLKDVAQLIMSELTPAVSAHHGAFFLAVPTGKDKETVAVGQGADGSYMLQLLGSYGYALGAMPTTFGPGESLIGTAAVEKRTILMENAPAGYLKITSGLGEATPTHVVVLPVVFEGFTLGVIELAAFQPFTQIQKDFLSQIAEMIATSVNTISVNTKTEVLLSQSQELTEQLQDRSAELENRQKALEDSNAQLEEKAAQLAQTNRDIEIKNSEIEEARQVLEERAEQLAVSMRYKSEFLANMSHELRTPLNSLLILAKLLADNADGNLSPKQVEFSETIHGAGSDLLQLINDILDLSKVEAGKMDVSPTRIALVQLVDYVEATFRPLTAEKNLDFSVRVSPELPPTLHTDEQRLLQVLRNLLSNAVKFTDGGAVELVIRSARADVPVSIREFMLEHGSLQDADAELIAFSVTDTGIGIAQSKMRVIFEAFKQADGTTSRKYGGTGLGLSISREIARLLGGEIYAASEPGRGSTFTLYLPLFPTELPPHGYAQLGGAQALPSAAREGVQEPREPAAVEEAPGLPALPAGVPDAEQAANTLAERSRRRAAAGGRRAVEDGAQGQSPEASADGADPESGESGGVGEQERFGPAEFAQRFRGSKVLIVDDDIRNVFALTSVLEQSGLQVLYAENGREGIEVLEQHDDAALVLMDIMMPEMDGYATMTAIRRMPQFAGLPIIALTAKAMKGDREKSIEAGASDYVTKPVDTDHLLTVMDQWMGEK